MWGFDLYWTALALGARPGTRARRRARRLHDLSDRPQPADTATALVLGIAVTDANRNP